MNPLPADGRVAGVGPAPSGSAVAITAAPGERDFCPGCFRARSVCYCDRIEKIRPRTRLVILQHPRERRRTVGSARIAHLCLEGSRLLWGAEFGENAEVMRLLADPTHHGVVLFPGNASLNLSEAGAVAQVAPPALGGRELLVFVIDGTWDCARSMINRSPNLRRLPRICFNPRQKSIYGFRRQPRPECLSTLEAVDELLRILEPGLDSQILMRLFKSMVEKQLSWQVPGQKRRGRI